MTHNPHSASETIYLRHYDLAYWSHPGQKWVPQGARLLWHEAVRLIRIKKDSHLGSWAVILVEGTVYNTDVTELVEREMKDYERNVGSYRNGG